MYEDHERIAFELLGGYVAHLTIEEQNEWNEYLSGHAKYHEYMGVQTVLDALDYLKAPEYSEDHLRRVANLLISKDRLISELFKIGKKWVEKNVLVEKD